MRGTESGDAGGAPHEDFCHPEWKEIAEDMRWSYSLVCQSKEVEIYFVVLLLENTVALYRMSHRKGIETKQLPSRARSGHKICYCLVSRHFLCDIL